MLIEEMSDDKHNDFKNNGETSTVSKGADAGGNHRNAAVRFHAKFAESNNLLLANSIANKIENEELREVTLSEISKQIVALKQNNNIE